MDAGVDAEDQEGEAELDRLGEPVRIDDLKQVVFDESLGVSTLAEPLEQSVLQVGERADPAGTFDNESARTGIRTPPPSRLLRNEKGPCRRRFVRPKAQDKGPGGRGENGWR